MKDIVLHQPDSLEHQQKGSVVVQQANEATVEDAHDLALAGSVMADLSQIVKAITLEFDGTKEDPGPTALAYRAWKSMVAIRDTALSGFQEAHGTWNRKVKRYEYDVEQKRLEEAKIEQAKADKIAQEERKRQIEEAKRQGDREAARALKEAPIIATPAAPKTPEVAKTEGIRRSSPDYGWVMVNENLIPDDLWMVNEKEISARVKRLGAKAGIPGISVYDKRAQ